jgi:hypothetical protein
MENKVKKLINEEIDKYMKKVRLDNPKNIENVLNELFYLSTDKLMNNIGSVEADSSNEIATENWDMFIDGLTQSIHDEQETWRLGIHNVKLKILTYKYFSRKEMVKTASLESYLRMEIKPFFTALQNYVDSKDFVMKFFQLPSHILYAIVRYMFFINKDLSKSVRITNDDLKKNIDRIKGKRIEVAIKIGKISNGYADLFDVKEIKDLYDNGVLFEDNFINRGINEFVYKLTNHKEAKNNMIDRFSGAMVTDISNQACESSAYIAHIASIRSETGAEYFSSNGEQIGKRFDNELDLIKEKNFEGYIVDKKSRLKEPNEKINTGIMPWEDNSAGSGVPGDEGAGPGGSGGGSGGGDSFGNADFGGDFAAPGEEGEIPGVEGGPEFADEDGTPMPEDENGLPEDFGTVEDNGGDTPEPDEEVEK